MSSKKKSSSGLRSLGGASVKMASATFGSRILGLVREQVIAATFGATGMTDAFNVAYRIPNMLRDLFAEGAFSFAFVPIFTEARIEDPLKARRLLWSMFVLLGTITGIISLGIMIFAPQLAAFLTSGDFLADPTRKMVSVQLIRLMGPFLTFISLAALFMGALNSLKIFFVPALAPAFFNVVMILSILFLPPWLKEQGYHGVLAMGVGVFVGGLIQMFIQVPLLFKVAYGPKGPLSFFNRDTQRITGRLGIGTVGIAANQINIIITTILATGTLLGAVSWLNYAFRLFQFPVGILSVSIANSNLVHFSDAWKEGDEETAVGYLRTSYFLSFLTIIPALGLLFALAEQSVNLVFERGAFNARDTQMTTLALKMYLLGLPFYGLYKIFAPTFFSLDKPKVPVLISVSCVSFNVAFCLILTPLYGFQVLALGTSVSMFLNSLLQMTFLRRYVAIQWRDFLQPRLLKLVLGGLACFAVANYCGEIFYNREHSVVRKIGELCLSGSFGALTYFLVLFLFGEGKTLKRVLKREKFKK